MPKSKLCFCRDCQYYEQSLTKCSMPYCVRLAESEYLVRAFQAKLEKVATIIASSDKNWIPASSKAVCSKIEKALEL